MKHWLLQVAVAIDQLINALFGGWADETLSSRAWRTADKGRVLGRIARPVIDTLLFFDKDHCKTAYESERVGRQLPPEARSTP